MKTNNDALRMQYSPKIRDKIETIHWYVKRLEQYPKYKINWQWLKYYQKELNRLVKIHCLNLKQLKRIY